MADEKISQYPNESLNPDPAIDKMDISTVAGGDESKFSFLQTILSTRLPNGFAFGIKGNGNLNNIADQDGDFRITLKGDNLVVQVRKAPGWEDRGEFLKSL